MNTDMHTDMSEKLPHNHSVAVNIEVGEWNGMNRNITRAFRQVCQVKSLVFCFRIEVLRTFQKKLLRKILQVL
jgi:hypothetical protein